MEGLAHILEERAWAFDANQLCTSGRATLEGDGRLAAAEVMSNEREQLLVRFAVDRRRFELRKPNATFGLRKKADARVRLDLDRDDSGLHSRGERMGPNVRHERRPQAGAACWRTSARWKG